MTSQKQLLFAYGLAVHLLVVGIVCYMAFPVKTPSKPIRLMYKTAAGKVLFDHNIHCSTSGYGATCIDCHHHSFEDNDNITSCSSCHPSTEDTFSKSYCMDCHESEEIEDIKIISRADALHSQCIQCHKDISAGPQDCSKCHIP